MTRAEVVTVARSWIGTPFRPKGRSQRGVDCIGLLVMIGRALNVPHEDEQHYTDWPDPQRRMLDVFDRHLWRRPVNEPNWDGTVGVFPTFRCLPGHVGIFSTLHGVRHLIHARADQRVVLEQPYDSDPRTAEMRLVARYGFPGLEA
jgi:hypothetical protein